MKLSELLMLAIGASVQQTPIPTRTPIGSFSVQPTKPVTHVETTRVDFLPGQMMPEHMHPVPVVCFVAKRRLAVSIGREPEHTVNVGESTIEHAGEVVHYFRNLSGKGPSAALLRKPRRAG
jgi:quercetin dioxygenase-like cupin family protein